MRFSKIYLEITDVCNLNCSFCPKTKRSPRFMSPSEFDLLADKIRPYTDFLYLHLMGEPLLHPELEKILGLCASKGFKTIITTNGTLLEKRIELLKNAGLFKINVSVHSSEANDVSGQGLDTYLDGVFSACRELGRAGVISVVRLWNGGGRDSENEYIIRRLRGEFPLWEPNKSGYKLDRGVYVEFGNKFDWPDINGEARGTEFCYALRDHCGVLCDGTVVPCCLDSDGNIPLGNLFEEDLNEILSGCRAKRIYEGFSSHTAVEDLCKHCGYASELRK